MLLGACSGDDAAAPAPSPTPTGPTTPAIEPIDADVTLAARGLSSGTVIDRGPSRPAEQAEVEALADGVQAWLDGHLDDLQRGGQGQLDDVALDGLLEDAEATLLAGVTSGLASNDDPVRDARYRFEVGHDGEPRWLRARVEVDRHSGATSEATFVFLPGDGGPVLIALEPRGGAA